MHIRKQRPVNSGRCLSYKSSWPPSSGTEAMSCRRFTRAPRTAEACPRNWLKCGRSGPGRIAFSKGFRTLKHPSERLTAERHEVFGVLGLG